MKIARGLRTFIELIKIEMGEGFRALGWILLVAFVAVPFNVLFIHSEVVFNVVVGFIAAGLALHMEARRKRKRASS